MTARNLKDVRERYYRLIRLTNFCLMAETYLEPVRASIVVAFAKDYQFCGNKYSREQGWSQELARYHLHRGLAKLEKISKQRVIFEGARGMSCNPSTAGKTVSARRFFSSVNLQEASHLRNANG